MAMPVMGATAVAPITGIAMEAILLVRERVLGMISMRWRAQLISIHERPDGA